MVQLMGNWVEFDLMNLIPEGVTLNEDQKQYLKNGMFSLLFGQVVSNPYMFQMGGGVYHRYGAE